MTAGQKDKMMEPIHISQVIIHHLSWKIRLCDFLNGDISMTEREVVSHKECELGKWLKSGGLDRYREIPEMQELKDVHRAFHESVTKFLECKYSDRVSSAEKELQKMEELSQKIFSSLLELKREIE